MVKNLKYFGVFVVLAFLLTACVVEAELPPAPSSTTPLVEYSVDEGETWHSLTKDEVKRLDVTSVQIRTTREGTAFSIQVVADISNWPFGDSVKRVGNVIVVEGAGGFIIRAHRGDYAKIILE